MLLFLHFFLLFEHTLCKPEVRFDWSLTFSENSGDVVA
jgi:hypothetical protein